MNNAIFRVSINLFELRWRTVSNKYRTLETRKGRRKMLEEGKQYYLKFVEDHWLKSEKRIQLVKVTTYGILVKYYKEDYVEPEEDMRHINWNIISKLTPRRTQ